MDQFQQPHQQNGSFNLPPITNPPPQFFGGSGIGTSPTAVNFDFSEGQLDGQDFEGGHDENDAKRRRIARVRSPLILRDRALALTKTIGM